LSHEELAESRKHWDELRKSMFERGGWPHETTRRRAADHTPEERQAIYESLWREGGIHLAINSFREVLMDKELNDEVSEFVRGKIREIVKDPDTARKLMPSYHFGTKRLILDNGYFETFNRDNVSLVDLREDPIESFTPNSVRTRDGEHALDLLVLATGFDAVTGSMLNINPKGKHGVALKEKWHERFETYLGTTIPDFPNLFMIHGPTSPGVLYTMPLGGERTTAWIADCISHMKQQGLGAMEATSQAAKQWDQQINEAANQTLYPLTDSWYMGANIPGKPRQFLAHLRGSQYFEQLEQVAQKDYEGFTFEPIREPAVGK
jgi:cation diffusion facilitator CzcD-associated flavoprotein CzcO